MSAIPKKGLRRIKQKWDVPGGLDEPARKAIQGNHLDYYLNVLKQTREKTLAELRKRDDQWLMAVDKDSGWPHQRLLQVVPCGRA